MSKKSWEQQADRGVELLQLCSDLQSEKDGIQRPAINEINKSKTLDEFAVDIQTAATNMISLYKLFPLMNDLSQLGRKLEAEGKITMEFGEDYSRKALDFVLNEHGVSK